MNAQLIAVGSEMLTAYRLDTNSLYLADQLNNLGIEVTSKCVVGDHRERLAEAVRRAMSSAQVVILCGGLGPTEDDVTREAVALALGRRLVFRPDLALQLEQRFARAGRRMAEVNKRQAFVLEGADILPNDRGTAPGQWVDDSGCSILLLPGPPHELKAMFERQCLPRLERRAPHSVIRTLVLRVAGMPESDLDQLISPVYRKYDDPTVTILAAAGDIQVHLRAHCASEAQALALLTEVGGQVEMLLGDRVYSHNGEPLEVVVGELLRKQRATVCVAESCTGGMLGERITSVPGSSEYFLGGFVTYTRRMKAELLGVPEAVLEECGAVSRETAEAMAAGARRRTGAGYALAITGVAGPDAAAGARVGTVYIGLADATGCQAAHRQFLGDRERVRAFAVQHALDLLRRRLAYP